MCGITGWVDWEKDLSQEEETLHKMTATLAVRGPDACGYYIKKHVAMGHRRLSVMDPANGAQPMIRMRGNHKFVVTYNGELYNTPELRQELEARGYHFTTNCDTEVLLTAYMEWGVTCVDKFNGIFAFAVWDEAKQRLFLARDRIGVKPLFYIKRDNSFIFGSELKALLAHPMVRPEIGPEGIAELFMIGPARTPGNGIFNGISELKPGRCMTYDQKGISIKQYWALENKPHDDDFSTTAEKVRELILDAVKRQLVSDVPLGILLSGGLDSSILTAIAAGEYTKKRHTQINTYSVDYANNERFFKPDIFQPHMDGPWIKRVSELFNTNNINVVLDVNELTDALIPAALARDLPGMADIDTSLYLFSREIKRHSTVVLSGECADEVFGGYPWFYREHMVQANTFPWAPSLKQRMEWLAPELNKKINPEGYVAERYLEALSEVPRLKGEDLLACRMREIFYLSLTRFMPTLLDRKDRMSMAFGLEIRVPYCDHRLVEYVWNVPWEMKNYHNQEKGLLRYALSGVLPDDVLWRRKSPYPKTHNPNLLTIVQARMLEILNNQSSPILQLINKDKIRELVNSDGGKSTIPWFGQLMSGPQLFAYLIQMNAWLAEYKVEITGI